MHVNMKYYVVSVGGIFISLGIGMLVGFNLNYDQELSNQQTQIINDLDSKFDELKNTNDNLENELKKLNLSYDKTVSFISSNIDKLVAEELSGQNIGIITTNGNTATNYIEDAIAKANGNIVFNLNFTNKITDINILNELSEKAEMEIKTTEEFIAYILDALKNEDAETKLEVAEELELINIRSLESNHKNSTSIVLNSNGNSEDFKEKFNNLDKILIDKLKAEDKYIVGVESTDAANPYIELYSENKIATVNNINEGNGKLALVSLLKDRSTIGNFGAGENVDDLIPYKEINK